MTGTSSIKTGLRAVVGIAALAAALVLPAQAFAQGSCTNTGSDPTAAQYCSVSAANSGGGNGPARSVPASNGSAGRVPVSDVTPSGTANSSGSGSLPFTGLDVGLLLLVAAVLTGTGLALWRLTATGTHED